jgi:hypothetical protein
MFWLKWIGGSLRRFEPRLFWVQYMPIPYCPKPSRAAIRAVVAALKALD